MRAEIKDQRRWERGAAAGGSLIKLHLSLVNSSEGDFGFVCANAS